MPYTVLRVMLLKIFTHMSACNACVERLNIYHQHRAAFSGIIWTRALDVRLLFFCASYAVCLFVYTISCVHDVTFECLLNSPVCYSAQHISTFKVLFAPSLKFPYFFGFVHRQATPSEVEALAAIRHINGVVLTTAGVYHRPNEEEDEAAAKKVHRSVNQLLWDDGEMERRKLNGKTVTVAIASDRAATATPRPPTTTLGDIFISVKTTKKNHDNRVELILGTWHQLAKQQVNAGNNSI